MYIVTIFSLPLIKNYFLKLKTEHFVGNGNISNDTLYNYKKNTVNVIPDTYTYMYVLGTVAFCIGLNNYVSCNVQVVHA